MKRPIWPHRTTLKGWRRCPKIADILIRGMEMPKNGHVVIRIYSDGRVENETTEREIGTAAPIRAGHGRLIDADALIDALETQDYSCAPDTLEDWTPQDMTVAEIADITHAPTIVPAEGGNADG